MIDRWLAAPAPDAAAGLGLLLIAVITAIWGATLLLAAYREPARRGVRRWLPVGFEFWLGLFLLLSDAGIYAILGVGVLRSTEPVPRWGVVYSLACAGCAVAAFGWWARERLPARRDGA